MKGVGTRTPQSRKKGGASPNSINARAKSGL